MMGVQLTQHEIKNILSYDSESGLFTWLTRRSMRILVGSQAGALNNKGYVVIKINGKAYKAHRLAWLYSYGSWPVEQVDHINGNRSDNRLRNLREATNAQNCCNQGTSKANSSGYRGVRFSNKLNQWQAHIGYQGKTIHLGYFPDINDAIKARISGEYKYFGDFSPNKSQTSIDDGGLCGNACFNPR